MSDDDFSGMPQPSNSRKGAHAEGCGYSILLGLCVMWLVIQGVSIYFGGSDIHINLEVSLDGISFSIEQVE